MQSTKFLILIMKAIWNCIKGVWGKKKLSRRISKRKEELDRVIESESNSREAQSKYRIYCTSCSTTIFREFLCKHKTRSTQATRATQTNLQTTPTKRYANLFESFPSISTTSYFSLIIRESSFKMKSKIFLPKRNATGLLIGNPVSGSRINNNLHTARTQPVCQQFQRGKARANRKCRDTANNKVHARHLMHAHGIVVHASLLRGR